LNQIHKTAIIGRDVLLGDGNIIEEYAVIKGNTHLGDNNWIGPHVVIGTPPEHKEFHQFPYGEYSRGPIRIGSKNVIHEHAAIQSPTRFETKLGDENFIMHGVHIAHDCVLRNKVTIAPTAVLGGTTRIGSLATIGIGVGIHQFKLIGGLAMVGMNSSVNKNIFPFQLVTGSPARAVKNNLIGLTRAGVEIGSWLDNLTGEPSEWDVSLTPESAHYYIKEYFELSEIEPLI